MDYQSLLHWFKQHARPLPWREHYRPYEVILSEYMLQQTQIKTALPYFHRWIKKWPDWKSLASAKEDEVLKLWEGLGYYQRARRLHELAIHVVTQLNSVLPQNEEELIRLPGIGPYTSAAISSIAFNQAAFPIDGNVRRVLSRYYSNSTPSPSPIQDEKFQASLLPIFKKIRKRRELAQAIMELGALICTPKKTQCDTCPLHKSCKAFALQQVDHFPIKKSKQKFETLSISFCWVVKDTKVLLRKRPAKGRFPHQWEAPNIEHPLNKEGKNKLLAWLKIKKMVEHPSFKRNFTKYKVTWYPYSFQTKNFQCFDSFEWIPIQDALHLNLIPVMGKNLKELKKIFFN